MYLDFATFSETVDFEQSFILKVLRLLKHLHFGHVYHN